MKNATPKHFLSHYSMGLYTYVHVYNEVFEEPCIIGDPCLPYFAKLVKHVSMSIKCSETICLVVLKNFNISWSKQNYR